MIAEKLKSIRKTVLKTQSQTAIAIGVTQQTYNGYETGRREPDLKTLCNIADYFNVSLDYLLGRTDEKESAPADWQGLTKEEHDFITILRTLSSDERKLVLAYMGGMHDLLSLKNDTVLIDGQEYVKISK